MKNKKEYTAISNDVSKAFPEEQRDFPEQSKPWQLLRAGRPTVKLLESSQWSVPLLFSCELSQ